MLRYACTLGVLLLAPLAARADPSSNDRGGASLLAFPTDAELSAAAQTKLQAAQTGLPTTADMDARLEQMNRQYRAIDYDPDLRAKDLGDGVEPAFKFVRDQIRFESYPGVLRGAHGTYTARAGNAADRAILLAHLLKTKGIATRFVTGQLDQKQAESLFNHIFDSGGVQSEQTAAAPARIQFLQRLRQRATRDFATIRNALGPRFPTSSGVSREQALKEIENHVWLEAKVGDHWTDLDSAFPDATVGKSFCQPQQTLEQLPANLYQQVTIRVIAEKLDGAALKREVALELTRPVVSLVERQIFLVHLPASGVGALGHALGGGGQNFFFPTLWIDGEVFGGKGIDFNDGSKAGKGGGGFHDVLDALDTPAPANVSPRFVSESIEFELTAPGKQPEITRRTLCDCGGAAWRLTNPLDPKQLKPLERNEAGVVAAQTLHNVWFSAGEHDMASYSQAMQMLAQAAKAPPATAAPGAEQPDFGQQAWPLVIKNLSWVLWGEHVFLPALNDSPNARLYLDSPRILIFSITAAMSPGSNDHFTLNTEVDLRRDKVRGLSRDPRDNAVAVNRKIWFGVLEGALEHELTSQESAALTGQVKVESTSGLLDDRGAVAMTEAPPAGSWEKLASSRETAARLHLALDRGDLLVVPRSALEGGQTGWWAISRLTGDTQPVLGYGINGSGLGSNGSYARGAPYGGSSGPSTNYVNPNNYNSYSPRRTARGGGNEYATVLVTISIPGGLALAGVIAVVASIIWIIVKILF